MKVILTGATGMVGEGVLARMPRKPRCRAGARFLAAHPAGLTRSFVSSWSRLPRSGCGGRELTGFDACFYCAGISSWALSEADYTVITYDTPLAFASTLARLNPG